MDVSDNEYYEARAKDVKLGDITSNEHNAGILSMLRDNDPKFTSISIGDENADKKLGVDGLPCRQKKTCERIVH